MRDVLAEIRRWYAAGETFGLATVVETFRSAPRPPGAAMAVSAGGEVVGSVSGGCVEGAVYELAQQVIGTGEPVLQRYGVSDDDAFAVGLTCGGIIDVFVEPVSRATAPELSAVIDSIERAQPVALATIIGGPGRIGGFLGYRVTVCDARPVFATARRFPDADEVVVEWPHRYLSRTAVDARTVICVLTHDPKFDVPLLKVALRTPAAYIGAMGSRRTHDDRLKRLRDEGLTDDELARLRSPLGLDIGARTPEETAVSIAAEIVQTRWGGTGRPLTALDGPIHHQA